MSWSSAKPTVEEALSVVAEPTADDYDRWQTIAEVLADEIGRLRILLSESPEHVIEFTDEGWTIMHPVACRPDLFACPVNRAAGDMVRSPVPRNGRYACALDGDGQFAVGRRVE